jgi:hypothetical protein
MTNRLKPIPITSETRVTQVLEEAADGPVLLEKDGALYALAPLDGVGDPRLYTEKEIEEFIRGDALDEEATTIAGRFGWVKASH